MQNCFDKCEKKKCCGVSKVVIPAALGDENGQYKPENGAYFNTLVEYQASGVSYMYTNDGIPTRMGDGIVATIEVGETTTLQPGEDATVENVGDKYHAVLIFGIPEGQKGDTGDAATVNVGTTTTGAPGSDATVTNSGDEHSAILNFTIPRGPQGEQGVPGQAATIAVGTVTTLDPDQPATVTNSGTSSAAVFDFGIPKGDKGDTGAVSSEVVEELPIPGDDSKFYLIEKNPERNTESGEYINFETTQTAAAIQSAQLNGNATQSGTPTPDSPQPISVVTGENVVKVVGKNLCSDVLTGTINWQGTRVDYYGDEIKITKPSTGGISANAHTQTQYTPLKQGQAYTFSMSYKNGTIVPGGSYGWVFYIYGVLADGSIATAHRWQLSVSNTSATPPTASVTFTPAQDYIGFRLGCYIAPSTPTTDGDVYFGVQLELGTTATTYQAYQGQDFEVNLGKNLFDKTDASQLLTNVYIGASALGTANGAYTAYIKCQPNTTYTVSKTAGARFICGTTTTTPATGVSVNDRTANNTASSITLTTSSTAVYLVAFYFLEGTDAGTQQAMLDSLQIEKGTQATSYAPYFTPLELAKIGTYQDRIYKDGEKWYVEKNVGKVVLDGTEAWISQTSNNGYMYRVTVADVPSIASSEMSNLLSDYFTPTTGALIYSVTSGGYMAQLTVAGYIRFNIGDTTDKLTDFKTWLSNNKPTVYYALATPTTTEIMNQTLIDQLEALASATLNQGVNNIWIEIATGNAMPTLELNWVEWEKYNRHNVYIWNDGAEDYQILNS